MSILGIDWNGDGRLDEMDLAMDMLILDEMEEEDEEDWKEELKSMWAWST